MPTSTARIAANRRNAALSTGPRTEAGKARSRANAVKHGLTGAGVALPGEDAAAVEELFAAIQEQMAPQSLLGTDLAHRVALLTVRKRRANAARVIRLRGRARRAGAEFDAARARTAEALIEAIEANPTAYRRALLALPEGVDRLIARLEMLLADLTGAAPCWTPQHHAHLDALFGFRVDDLPRNRPTRFSLAVLGDSSRIGTEEPPNGGEDARVVWALEQLMLAIDAEIERLRAHRAALDHEAIAQDRADAERLAGLEADADAEKAARYEAAAARELSQTLRDFDRAEDLAARPRPDPDADLDPVSLPVAEPEPAVPPLAVPVPDPDPAIVTPTATPAGPPTGVKGLCQIDLGRDLGSFGGDQSDDRSSSPSAGHHLAGRADLPPIDPAIVG